MTWTTKKSVVLAFVLALAVCSCFTMVRGAQAVSAPGPKTEAKLASIESISVDGEGDGTELVIKLSAPATYTSYKTTAPLRLVVDLSQVTQGDITAPLVVNKGNFKTVTVSRYDTDAGVLTRVDIELVKDAEAVISSAPNQKGELRVSFPTPPAQINTAAVVTSPTAELVAPETVKEGVIPVNEVPVVAESVPSDTANTAHTSAALSGNEVEAKKVTTPEVGQARLLTGIFAKNNLIELSVEGGVGEFKTFRLSKPERLVIDLFDVNSGLPSRIVPINAAGVASARLGLYPDKVRVVFDAVNGTFPEANVSKSEKGISVALNVNSSEENPNTRLVAANSQKAAETSQTLEAKVAEHQVGTDTVAEPAIEKPHAKPVVKAAEHRNGPATVEMIDFQVIDGISRVSVKVSGDTVVEPPEIAPGFVTITIKNALLPKHLQRSLETKGFISPVLRVTPFWVKTSKGTDTKIRIALRSAVTPEFRREGDMIFVDFKTPEGMTAERAAVEVPEPHSAHVAKAATLKAAELSDELLPSSEPLAAKKYKGRKVTLEFADADVRKIFQLLAEVSNKNFVLGDDVSGTISIKLVNVPWDQALDIILDAKGLDKREEGNIIIIKGKGKFKSQAEEEQEIKRQQFRSIELKTETFTINYADIGSIVAQFTAIKSERGTIAQDSRTNKVIVKDIPQALDDMRKLLQQLDVPERQVMIEARIVEATSTFTRSLGVNWGVHYRDGSASFAGINSLDTGFGGLTSAPPTTGTGLSSGSTMGISFGTLTSNIQLDMRLNAAASAGLIKIVSTPKVATINNKTAKITQGQQIPYTSSTSDKVETKFIEAALSLEVTPHINANGTIGMKIDAKNDSPGSSSGSTAPPINKKQATTEMLLRDGETTVIGGIYVDSDNESDDGVPFLMDIPFIGSLFKTNNKTKTKTELLIFITPRILGAI